MIKKRFVLIVSTIVVLLVSLPYVFAFQTSDLDSQFGGFLINAADGHSYLAKMQQGYQGNWRFVLPYTADPGDGAYLFMFYIGLGHLARIINFPVVVIYHAARVIGAGFLLWSIYHLMGIIFNNEKDRHLGYFITTIGSGLGWITIFGGYFSSDFWVAEAYPFLSMYTNPHFSIGLALMIMAIIPGKKIPIFRDILLGAAIAVIQPFGLVIVFIVRGAFELVKIMETRFSLKNWVSSPRFHSLLAFGIGGGSILVYQYASILADPVLSAWNQQNITTSPEIFDLIISFAPCLLLAGFGIRAAWQNEETKYLVIWAAASLMLIYLPWNLQRRFLTGTYIPLAALSVFGLNSLGKRFGSVSRWGTIILAGLVLPTNCIILYSGIHAASIQDPNIYISDGIIQGLNWIEKNSKKDALILTDEVTGLFIPSYTGRRVIYGHPFETINADDELYLVESFFDGSLGPEEYSKILAERNVGYIFLRRPAVQQLSEWIRQNELLAVFDYQDYKIYAVGRK